MSDTPSSGELSPGPIPSGDDSSSDTSSSNASSDSSSSPKGGERRPTLSESSESAAGPSDEADRPTGRSGRLWAYVGIAGLCIAAFVLGRLSILGVDYEDASPRSEDIEVRNFRYVEQPNGDREFTAEVHNTGADDIPVAQIEVSLFDETGARVGTQNIEVQDIPANGSRSFTQALTHDGPVGQARVNSAMAP